MAASHSVACHKGCSKKFQIPRSADETVAVQSAIPEMIFHGVAVVDGLDRAKASEWPETGDPVMLPAA